MTPEPREKRSRPAAEYATVLAEQLNLLARSSAAFDAGERAEAGRIALSLRLLLHDKSRTP